MSKYRKHQREVASERRIKKKQKESSSSRNKKQVTFKPRYNTRSSKARVQELHDMIQSMVSIESDQSDTESYQSANDSSGASVEQD